MDEKEQLRAFIVTDDYQCHDGYINLLTCNSPEVIPDTVGQYTGLKDKNGKEIYEGDIIRKLVWNEQKYMETNNGECYSYAKISYIEELAGFYIVNKEGKICWELGQDKYGIEVCGNIYDNPELLKEVGDEAGQMGLAPASY